MAAGLAGIGQNTQTPGRADADFLAQISWAENRGDELHRWAQVGNIEKFWRAWNKSLANRTDKKLRHQRRASRCGCWPWTDLRRHPARELLAILQKRDERRLARWLATRRSITPDWALEQTPWELLLLADWLLCGNAPNAELGVAVWRLVLTWANSLRSHIAAVDASQTSADRRLLLSGELPWTLGQLLADVDGITSFKQLGQQSLRNELIELTDGDGTPAAVLLPILPRWLASLARSTEVGVLFGEPLLEGEARFRFEDLITKSAMLLDVNGGLLPSTDRAAEGLVRRDGSKFNARTSGKPATAGEESLQVGACEAMLSRAAALAGLDRNSLAFESLRVREHTARTGSADGFRSETYAETPEERLIVTDTDLPAVQSDWAGWACLRNWWNATANSAFVRHDGPCVWTQFSPRGLPVIDGEWELKVLLDGEPLTWTQPWKCSCWSSDTDMDYIELQLELPGGPMLCRQVMLSRKDQFMVVADAVSRVGSRRIDLETRWPLSPGVRSQADTSTREIRLGTKHAKVRCFPLALPEDRALSSIGRFSADSSGLSLTQAATSQALYAPVVFDWASERGSLDAEWRPLTVTEEGQKLRPWQAAGFRLRLGKLHLVLYRSLDSSDESRAVLGLHTNQESVIAQFNEKGYVLPIVSVEA